MNNLPCSIDPHGFEPLRAWEASTRCADQLLSVSMAEHARSVAFFGAYAHQILSVLLHAAALEGSNARQVIRWMYLIQSEQTHAEVKQQLHQSQTALGLWEMFARLDPRMQRDVAATMEAAVIALQKSFHAAEALHAAEAQRIARQAAAALTELPVESDVVAPQRRDRLPRSPSR